MKYTVTVQELFDYAVESDCSLLAHGLFWAISRGHVRPEDDSDRFKNLERDDQAIQELVKSNLLGIGRIKLFVIQTNQLNLYAFYLAENVLDASRLHEDYFREDAKKITRADRLMIPYMTFANTGQEESLYEHRKSIVQFPAYVGHAIAGQRVLHRLEG